MKSKTISKTRNFGKVKFKYYIEKLDKQYTMLRIKILKNELYIDKKWNNGSFFYPDKIVFSRAKVGCKDSIFFNNNIVNVNTLLQKILNDDIIYLGNDRFGIQLK